MTMQPGQSGAKLSQSVTAISACQRQFSTCELSGQLCSEEVLSETSGTTRQNPLRLQQVPSRDESTRCQQFGELGSVFLLIGPPPVSQCQSLLSKYFGHWSDPELSLPTNTCCPIRQSKFALRLRPCFRSRCKPCRSLCITSFQGNPCSTHLADGQVATTALAIQSFDCLV
ncbi:MAG: hypothetical protein ACRDXX_14905 [Stackebrandtia sp.]